MYANTHQDDMTLGMSIPVTSVVLERLRLANLTARASKTQFSRDERSIWDLWWEIAKLLLTLTR